MYTFILFVESLFLACLSYQLWYLVWFLLIYGGGLWLFKSVTSLSGWSPFVVDCRFCLLAALCCLGWVSSSHFVVVVCGWSNCSPGYFVGVSFLR